MKKIKNIIKFPILKMLSIISDEIFIKIEYFIKMGKKCNLQHPQRFSEKLQWLKLNHRNELITIVTDKYEVRNYIAQKIGNEYLNKLLWVGDRPEDIPYDKLPNKYVIKVNHGCAFNIINDGNDELNIQKTNRMLNRWLKCDYHLVGRQWAYKNITRKIIIEKFMEDENFKDLIDYKLFVLNGNVEFIQVIINRTADMDQQFFTRDWEPIKLKDEYEIRTDKTKKPEALNKMIELSQKIGMDFIFCRVDFYVVNGKIIFGEITNYPLGGYLKLSKQYDEILGKKLELNTIDIKNLFDKFQNIVSYLSFVQID